MNTPLDMRPDDDADLLAGEYVLGTLPADEVAAIESRLARDASLAVAVTAWMRRLFVLTQLPQPMTPPSTLWPRIERSLDAPGAQTPVRRRPRAKRGAWLALAASLVFAVLVAALLPRSAPSPIAVTVLSAPDGTPGWVVQAFADGTVSVNPLADTRTEVATGSTLQFWTKRNNVEGPVSLGLVTPAGAAHVSLGKLPAPVDGQIFELTLEPAGGSTVGHPTGPVLYKGLSAGLPSRSS
jgi:anti-sigma-K factor RskA